VAPSGGAGRYYGDAVSWNLRDKHMFTRSNACWHIAGLSQRPWSGPTPIPATEMGQVRGEHNIGQLARFGEEAALIGFGTDRGTVAAASYWDGPMEIKRVRAAREDSYEGRSRDADIPAFFLETGPGQKRTFAPSLQSPCLSGPSGSSTGQSPSSSRIISRPSCRGSSMPGSGLRRLRLWRRSLLPMPTVSMRPIPSGCRTL
jgi:Erythromycin esterase